MDIWEILAIILGIPAFIIFVLPILISFWAESIAIDAIMDAFGVHPIIAGIISILGIITLIYVILKGA